jgi:hypothetical protein
LDLGQDNKVVFIVRDWLVRRLIHGTSFLE